MKAHLARNEALDASDAYRIQGNRLDWPQWATVSLVLVVLTSILTVAATLNDIW